MEAKSSVQSKTVWFNTLSAIGVAIIAALLEDPTFTELVGVGTVIAMNIANVILRRFTYKPLKGVLPPRKKLNPVDQALLDEAEANGMI